MKFIFVIFILLFPFYCWAQQSDQQLAYTYYQNKEYDKAADLFIKLYERTRSSNFLDFHIICLINAKDYEKAEATLKKLLKSDENNKDFLVNLGYIYEQKGETKKSLECYEKTIKKLIPSSLDINNLAYRFRDIREYGWAVKVYERGSELLKKPDAFITELGDCHMMERNYEKMFTFFCQAIEKDPSAVEGITFKLNFARSYDIINSVDTVIERNLKEIFKNPNYSPAYDELGVWYDLQKSNYTSALQHAIRLNQKFENKIHIFLNIARAASTSGKYNIARQAYGKVLERGKENNNFYTTAEKEILTCTYQEYGQQPENKTQYQTLAQTCNKYMLEHGYTYDNADIAILLSDIYAYYLSLPDSADVVLLRAETGRMMNGNALYTIKSKRADLLTFIDNPWEATILYTQIEKANPNNDIGYEAKLKKAWLAYYSGDLLWAKAQFDVLKGATTKLISNDAIKMAHFINTNYEEDSDNLQLEKLAKSEYLIYKKQYAIALLTLDSVITNGPQGISDYATLVKAKLFRDQFNYKEAIPLLEKIKDGSSQTYIQAEAIYELAGIKVKKQETSQALELYKKLVSDYPGSVYSIEGGRLYREIEKNQPEQKNTKG